MVAAAGPIRWPSCRPGAGMRCVTSADPDRDGGCSLQLAHDAGDALYVPASRYRGHRGERVGAAGRVPPGRQRHLGAEVDRWDAAAAGGGEGEQTELVVDPGGAPTSTGRPEDCGGPRRRPGEAPHHRVRHQVLAGDADRPVGPGLAQSRERRHHQLSTVASKPPRSNRSPTSAAPWLRPSPRRLDQLGVRVDAGARPGTPGDSAARTSATNRPARVPASPGRGPESTVVEPVAGRGALRGQQLIATLPGAQRVREPGDLGRLLDGQQGLLAGCCPGLVRHVSKVTRLSFSNARRSWHTLPNLLRRQT